MEEMHQNRMESKLVLNQMGGGRLGVKGDVLSGTVCTVKMSLLFLMAQVKG